MSEEEPEELKEVSPEEGDELEKEAQRLLEAEVANEMLEVGPMILGEELRPVTLASIALLMQTDSDLIKGVEVEECDNIILDCCRFIRIQTLPLREAARLVRDPEALDIAALEFADQIPPDKVQEVIGEVTKCLQSATSNRVEPVEDDAKSELQNPDEIVSGKS